MAIPPKTGTGSGTTAPTRPTRPTPAATAGGARHSRNNTRNPMLFRAAIGAALTIVLIIVGTALFQSTGASWGAGIGAFLTFMIMQKNVPGIGWKMASFTFCHPAGFFFAASFMSTVISAPFTWIFDRIPGNQTHGLGIVLVVIGYAAMVVDGLRRGPDMYAVWAGVLLPCLSGAIGGSFGTWLLHYGKDLRDYITAHTVPTFGDISVFALALLFFLPMLYCRHVYHEKVREGDGYARRFYRWARSKAS
jgi:hypothetical protein